VEARFVHRPNRFVVHACLEAGDEVVAHLADGALPELRGWRLVRWEAPFGASRLDFLLERRDGRRMYLEAKSVTLVRDGVALFPDAGRIVAARSIDPVFADTLAHAEELGVRVLGRRCAVEWNGIRLGERVRAGAGEG